MKSEDEQLEMIRRCIDGTETEAEHRALQEALRRESTVRRLYARYANVDAALGGGGIALHEDTHPVRLRLTRWLASQPLTAAVAGMVIGLFSASLVWAVAAPRMPGLHRHALSLVNADFENEGALSADGVPVVFGIWSGDRAEITDGQSGVQPRHGSRMFRFLRSDSSLPTDVQKSQTGNLYQVVDLSHYRNELADGQARIDWSVWFQWVPSANEKGISFAVNVWTFNGDPSILTANWRDHLYRETAKSGSRKSFDDSPAQWRELKGSMLIPPETDYLVIELKVIPPEAAPGAEPYSFAGCYADDVRIVLGTAGSAGAVARGRN